MEEVERGRAKLRGRVDMWIREVRGYVYTREEGRGGEMIQWDFDKRVNSDELQCSGLTLGYKTFPII